MKRQRSTAQMKEQTRNTQDQINEEEIGRLPKKRFQNNDNDAPKTQKLSGENARSNKHD